MPVTIRLPILLVAISTLGGQSSPEALVLPTGKRITPLATPGAQMQSLNPDLPEFPDYLAGQAVSSTISPNGKTLLVLTSGFNRVKGIDGKQIDSASNEYVFLYDIANGAARKRQVLQVPNTFAGIAFAPGGDAFYVGGGKDDNVHCFAREIDKWKEKGEPVRLGHTTGLGLHPGKETVVAGGIAVTPDGKHLIAANVYNDSISVVDLETGSVSGELDLRPGKSGALGVGVAGGEYPFGVICKGNHTAYVSSLRDREIVEVELGEKPRVAARIRVRGNPSKMILNRAQSRLFVVSDNSDSVTVIDTATDKVVERINTTAPEWLFSNAAGFTGSAPNDLVLSHNEQHLYVTNGGSNSVAIIKLGTRSVVSGLLPTAWYPSAIAISRDDRILYVANGKTLPGPNPNLHLKTNESAALKPGPDVVPSSGNQYIYQLEKASLLTMPLPDEATLRILTQKVGSNNGFGMTPDRRAEQTMRALRQRIKHVIYIIKENRTYDQVLGDLPRGNGDPKLTEFGEKITPNFHRLASQFVTLDNFYDSGEVSGDGWPWSTSARESDFGVKAVPLNYAGRGTSYEYEGPNRDINVGLATMKERLAANPKTPVDPDLLPGAVNVAEPDGPKGTQQGKGYIWDAVLRAGLTFREYGCMSDMAADAPREPYPFKAKVLMQRPANPELYKFGDPYYRGFDPGYPDFYREAEWEREFDDYVARRNLPTFEIVQLPGDHMGDFDSAISGVNTPEAEQADNDYAVGRLVDRVAHSPYAADTLIFSIEDDSQDGPDHVDAHRTTAYVVGPYVRRSAVISTYYTTVSMIRTIEDVLGLQHLNLNTATALPMTDVFDVTQKNWTYAAKPSAVLAGTKLPLSEDARKAAQSGGVFRFAQTPAYWARRTAGFDFSGEDRVDAESFNRIIWQGLTGTPYPATHPFHLRDE